MSILANTFVIIPSSPSSPVDGQLIVDPTSGLLGIYDSSLGAIRPNSSSGSSGSSGSSSSAGSSGSSGSSG